MIEPLIRQAERSPDKTALIFQGRSLSYGELLSQVNRTARTLSKLGVNPTDRVAYVLENRIEIVTVFYAIQALGAVAVPINVRSIAPEIAYLAKAVKAKVLLYSALRAEQVEQAASRLERVEALCVDPGRPKQLVLDLDDSPFAGPRVPGAISRIQFTGGSTGTPKGAMRTHAADLVNIAGTSQASFLDETPGTVVFVGCPLEHHGGHAWFTMAIAQGATLVIGGAFDPAEVLRAIETHRVTHIILLPPTTYVRLMEHESISDFDLSSVKILQTSAGAVTRDFVANAYRYFPNCAINYGWGQTESGLGSTMVLTREMLATGDSKLESVGLPMAHTELRLADDDGNDVATGEIAECLVRSEAVMRGYWEQPELTAEVLPGDGWLRTGDMMSRDADGYYYLRYRKKDMIKTGGENVFSAEVESVVAAHPAVVDCAVYGVAHPTLGEAVAVAVELHPGATLTLGELQEWTKERIASYKKPLAMRVMENLGRDLSGKVDKRRLAAEHTY
ncbi:MAG: AMP-binding protein [Propionibacteriaceae bacterium]|nr:AMP-binding protein [Propionibacteriaceae bacterium]